MRDKVKFSRIDDGDRIHSKCGRFTIRRFPDWYINGRAVWELRDDGADWWITYDRLKDAKEMANNLANL